MSLHTARVAPEKRLHRPPAAVQFSGGRGEDVSQRIGAIETEYMGHRFRSRIEARWAVAFDAIGIRWAYESQGFEGGGARWLPDFYLPDCQCWVEVKGLDIVPPSDRAKMLAVLGSGAVPDYLGSIDYGSPNCGVALLGDIPADDHGHYFFPMLRHSLSMGHLWDTSAFACNRGEDSYRLVAASPGLIGIMMGYSRPIQADASVDAAWSTKPFYLGHIAAYPRVRSAFNAARSARFEHGERGGR